LIGSREKKHRKKKGCFKKRWQEVLNDDENDLLGARGFDRREHLRDQKSAVAEGRNPSLRKSDVK